MRHVFECRSGDTRFYLVDNVAYDINTHETRYWIDGARWFLAPTLDGPPALIEKDGFLFDETIAAGPLYRCR